MSNQIWERIGAVRAAISEAAQRARRSCGEIELVAVSKGHDAEAVRAAMEDGQLLFGESKVQEAQAKVPLLPSHVRWHFIGHLQSNKVRHALPLFELIHGVDSLELAQQINRVAKEQGLHPRVLLQVNVAGEARKFGWRPEALRQGMTELLNLNRLSIEGLMTIAPLAEEADASRPHFIALRQLRESLEQEYDVTLPKLSMGMSGDFAVAIEEGATLVRIGTAIFGKRVRAKDKGSIVKDSV